MAIRIGTSNPLGNDAANLEHTYAPFPSNLNRKMTSIKLFVSRSVYWEERRQMGSSGSRSGGARLGNVH